MVGYAWEVKGSHPATPKRPGLTTLQIHSTPTQIMSSYFPDVPKIAFEGPKSKNPLSYKHYNPAEMVEGKTMARRQGRIGKVVEHVDEPDPGGFREARCARIARATRPGIALG